MTETIITNFQELLNEFEREVIGQNVIYRGHSKSNYQLITSLGRVESLSSKTTILELEKRLLRLFKESSIPYIEHKPTNELEWLAVAQHFGLPTRLLDWSYNPLIATFFAVESNPDDESAVFVFSGGSTIQDPQKFKFDSKEKVQKYRPPRISSRIQNQAGLFTVHNKPDEVFEHDSLKKIIIPKGIKKDVKKILFKYGINQRLIYPGLEGVAKDLKWLETKMY